MHFTTRLASYALAYAVSTGFSVQAAAAEDIARPKLALMPLDGKGQPVETVEIMDRLLSQAVHDLEEYDLVTVNDIKAILGLEGMRQAMGCDDVLCISEIGGALGADLLVTGSFGLLGKDVVLSLTLLDMVEQKALAREQTIIPNDASRFADAAVATVRRLFGFENLAEGRLEVTSDPPGATATLDGNPIGTTPVALEGRHEGEYQLRLELEGYVTSRARLQVHGGQTTTHDATLISLERAAEIDMERGHRQQRAFISFGASAVLLGGGIATLLLNRDRDDINREEYREFVSAENEQEAVARYDDVKSAVQRHNVMVGVGIGLLGVSAVALGYGVFELLSQPAAVERLAVGPTEGGVAVAVGGRF